MTALLFLGFLFAGTVYFAVLLVLRIRSHRRIAVASGAELDRIGWAYYRLDRFPNESDARYRGRLLFVHTVTGTVPSARARWPR